MQVKGKGRGSSKAADITIVPMHEIARAEAIAALKAEYGVISDIVGSLSREELLEPSGCLGWNNADLIFHMLLDAQRALVAFNSPAAPPADKDFVTYWEGFQASDDRSRVHERFVRISTAAHQDSKMICSRWIETSTAAIRASGTSDTEVVTTQGHLLTFGNFIATLVVEAAIHHLDPDKEAWREARSSAFRAVGNYSNA